MTAERKHNAVETGTISLSPDEIQEQLSRHDAAELLDPEVTEESPARYDIRNEKGRGGIGKVMIAFDHHVGREIAVKELLSEYAGSIADREHSVVNGVRFLREARVTGQLEHPNIVPVYEIGKREDGTVYYTMRLVKGKTLHQAIQDADDRAERLRLLPHFRDICNAVAYAHSRGVIHRDIKPQNIMIGQFGETVVLDWGLAKVCGEQDPAASELRSDITSIQSGDTGETVSGRAMGTPAYMPPEQARGTVESIDEKSDIYSLGAVLYEILTGDPPVRGVSAAEIMQRVMHGDIIPVRDIEPDAPPDLCAVVNKSLQTVPGERYEKVIEISREIENYMSGRRVETYEYSAWELVKRFVTGNRSLSVLIILLAITFIVSSAVVFNAFRESVRKEREAHLNLSRGYLENARRLLREKKYGRAEIYAAAALYHNPYNDHSPWRYGTESVRESSAGQKTLLPVRSAYYMARVFNNNAFVRDLHVPDYTVTDIAVSPDGAFVAFAGRSKSIILYDIENRTVRAKLTGHTDEVSSVVFSADSSMLVSGSWDGTFAVWNVRDGVRTKTFSGNVDRIYSVAVSPDGDRVAAGDGTGRVHVWDIVREKKLHTYDLRGGKVRALSFSPSGSLLVAADSLGRISFIEEETVKMSVRGHTEAAVSIAFSPDNRVFATAGYDKKIQLWDPETGKILNTFNYWDAFYDLSFSFDGTMLAAASRSGSVRLIDLENGRVNSLRGHEGSVRAVAFLRGGKRLLSGGNDKMIKLWRTNIRKQVDDLRGHATYIPVLSYAADGGMLLSSSWDRTIRVWDVDREKELKQYGPFSAASIAAAFAPDGIRIVAAGLDGKLRYWDSPGSTTPAVRQMNTEGFGSLAFSPDGNRLALGGQDGTVRFFNMNSGLKGRVIPAHDTAVKALAWGISDEVLFSGGRDRRIRMWDTQTGHLIRNVGTHRGTVLSLDVSPDGTRIASGGDDTYIHICHADDNEPCVTLSAHDSAVNMVRFSPDGRYLVSVGKSLVIWDVEQERARYQFPLQYEGYSCAFSPDGSSIAFSEGRNMYVIPVVFDIWDKDAEELLKDAQLRSGKHLKDFQLIPMTSE